MTKNNAVIKMRDRIRVITNEAAYAGLTAKSPHLTGPQVRARVRSEAAHVPQAHFATRRHRLRIGRHRDLGCFFEFRTFRAVELVL